MSYFDEDLVWPNFSCRSRLDDFALLRPLENRELNHIIGDKCIASCKCLGNDRVSGGSIIKEDKVLMLNSSEESREKCAGYQCLIRELPSLTRREIQDLICLQDSRRQSGIQQK